MNRPLTIGNHPTTSPPPVDSPLRISMGKLAGLATTGCPFCTLLMANADTSFLSEHILYQHVMLLKRALIDPEQSFQLFIGPDDFSRTYFFRVPPEWSLFAFPE